MNLRMGFSLSMLLLATVTTAARADLYSNPYNESGNGNCVFNTLCDSYALGDTYAAQKFTLATGGTVTSANYTTLLYTNGVPGTSVNYAFYTSVSGLPGAVISSGSSPITGVNLGLDPVVGFDGLTDEVYTFNVNPQTFAPGSYFIAIQEVTIDSANYLAAGVASSGSAESDNGGVSWFAPYAANFSDLEPSVAISLNGTAGAGSATPEPNAIYLLGTGLAGVAALRRRFKK